MNTFFMCRRNSDRSSSSMLPPRLFHNTLNKNVFLGSMRGGLL
ncbi:hypothetical protein Q7O_000246 [Pectobacterium carotovorum subsp. carotovorum PCCS1]|nr:hypothetical protein [Pectobacterium carotovorum subsp. carotovorum PCCS1]